jgi:hypothetical protein
MDYVFDNNTLTAIFRHYYVDQFPSFWEKFNRAKGNNRICSVREVVNEIKELKRDDELEKWIKVNREFFHDPSSKELVFIGEIYRVKHFQNNIEKKKILHGGPFADPFIIAKAKIEDAIVITQEHFRENGAQIPNICDHFHIEYMDLKGFLSRENWVF